MTNGSGRCRMHGGKSLRGLASPRWKTGRWSKYVPRNLTERYHEALLDPDLLNLSDDVALLRAMTSKHLTEIGEADANPAWIDAKKAHKKMVEAMNSGNADKLVEARDELADIINPHYRAAVAEGKVSQYIDQVGRIADKERKIMLDKQQMITVEKAMVFITAVVMGLRESVLRYCDKKTAGKILNDANTAYSRAIGSGGNKSVIDLG